MLSHSFFQMFGPPLDWVIFRFTRTWC